MMSTHLQSDLIMKKWISILLHIQSIHKNGIDRKGISVQRINCYRQDRFLHDNIFFIFINNHTEI